MKIKDAINIYLDTQNYLPNGVSAYRNSLSNENIIELLADLSLQTKCEGSILDYIYPEDNK